MISAVNSGPFYFSLVAWSQLSIIYYHYRTVWKHAHDIHEIILLLYDLTLV